MLSQEEINTLLEGLEAEKIPQQESGEGREQIRKIELAAQERLVRGRLPALELIFDRFARNFRTVLEQHVGKPCNVTPAALEREKFGRFSRRLSLPSSMHLFRLPPLSGQAVLVCSASLIDALVDASFGGSGMPRKKKPATHEFTAIENRLTTKVVHLALDELKEAWSVVFSVSSVYVRTEFNPLGLSIAAPSDNAVTASFEVEIDGQSAELQICLPYPMIERIRDKLSTGIQAPKAEDQVGNIRRMQANLLRATVSLSVELARGRIKVRDLLALEPGQTLMLETPADAPALVRLEGVEKYTGRVGNHGGCKAVELKTALLSRVSRRGLSGKPPVRPA